MPTKGRPTKGRQTKPQYAYFPLSLDLELYSMFLLNVQFVSQSEQSKKTEGNEQIHLKSPFIKCKIKLIKSWSNLPSLYIYINSANARAMLTSVCSSGWGDCGGVITCSLHISSVMPSSNGGGNGMLASGGTSTSNCAKNKGLPLNFFSLILEK